jgi:hypothetical protein
MQYILHGINPFGGYDSLSSLRSRRAQSAQRIARKDKRTNHEGHEGHEEKIKLSQSPQRAQRLLGHRSPLATHRFSQIINRRHTQTTADVKSLGDKSNDRLKPQWKVPDTTNE